MKWKIITAAVHPCIQNKWIKNQTKSETEIKSSYSCAVNYLYNSKCVHTSFNIHVLPIKSPKLSAKHTITGMSSLHTPVPPQVITQSKYTQRRTPWNGHVDTQTNELMQEYTNELMHHFQKSGHGSCTYAHWQNLTNVGVKTTPAGLPPSLHQLLFHHSPPLSPDNSCTTPAAHHSLPNTVGCVNTAHSHIHRGRTVGLVWVSSPGLAVRALRFS